LNTSGIAQSLLHATDVRADAPAIRRAEPETVVEVKFPAGFSICKRTRF
jgi:hypothetical protein